MISSFYTTSIYLEAVLSEFRGIRGAVQIFVCLSEISLLIDKNFNIRALSGVLSLIPCRFSDDCLERSVIMILSRLNQINKLK